MLSRRLRALATIGAGCLAVSSLGCFQKPFDPLGEDWANVTLSAAGEGRPADGSLAGRVEAVHQAREEAYRLLSDQMMQMKTATSEPVAGLISGDDAKARRLRDFARSARIVRTQFRPDGVVRVETELYLGDDLLAALGISRKRPERPQKPGVGREGRDDFVR